MTKLIWDQNGERYFELGCRNAALYIPDDSGVYGGAEGLVAAWNGLTEIDETPDGGDETALFGNDSKYGGIRAVETYGGTIKAYTFPDLWNKCDGYSEIAKGAYAGQQPRKVFGLAYKTDVGNDVAGTDFAYKLHMVWGATASPSEKDYATINDDPDAIEFSWDFTCTGVAGTNFAKPVSHMYVNSWTADSAKLKQLEDTLFGGETAFAKLPTPDEVYTILETAV